MGCPVESVSELALSNAKRRRWSHVLCAPTVVVPYFLHRQLFSLARFFVGGARSSFSLLSLSCSQGILGKRGGRSCTTMCALGRTRGHIVRKVSIALHHIIGAFVAHEINDTE
jgi:hypothetical protein